MAQGAEDSAIKITVAWIAVAGSAAASLIALVTSLLSQRASRRSQREVEALRARSQRDIEALKAELGERQAEKNARRDYEYKARMRLYEECEPIMFHLYESSVGGLKRVRSLARTARDGDLGPGAHSWLRSEGYYTLSTVYMLLAPLTAFKLIQRRLTLVDLTVDPQMRALYLLAKQLYLSFTADFKLARQPPALEYKPNVEKWEVKRHEQPAVYWRQGLPVGRLDSAVGSLITADAAGNAAGNAARVSRCMSFGEFEVAYHDTGSDVQVSCQMILDIFLNFHPRQRPVLWRVLIAQLHLYRAVISISEGGYGPARRKAPLVEPMPAGEREPFDWRQAEDEAGDDEVLVAPFAAAETYLAEVLGEQPVH